ncbi:MAG TPA: hypothetical protein VE967_01135 [Gemmatimonadaceae bacterium]|nr:hypothetical protein [Gemmatimonadaceae bacterium]
MHRNWRILALIVPCAAAAQQPGSAGANRPKLEVLKSLPEAQLFPVMNLVASSLGVRCDYCHMQANPDLSRTPSNIGGWAWDSDDKQPKRRAREMMKMVVDLNTSQFGGEAKVTCFTCHRGGTQPVRLPQLPPPPPGTVRTQAPPLMPSAEHVIAAYVAAVGRVDPERAGTGMIIRRWDDRPEGRYGKLEITLAGPNRYRFTLTTPETVTSQGLDGDSGWTQANDRVQRFTSPADIARVRRIVNRYRPVKEQPPNLRVVGIERIDDRDAYVLQARIDSVTTQRSYFDAITGLLKREITTTETLLLPLEEQIDYSDYRDVSGVQMPFTIRISDGGSYSTTTRTFLDIRRNVPVDDALFRTPPGK